MRFGDGSGFLLPTEFHHEDIKHRREEEAEEGDADHATEDGGAHGAAHFRTGSGGDDERIHAGIPGFETAVKKAGIDCRIHLYEGPEHGFNNDTGARYNKEAAALAWKRTVDFFREKL